MRKWQLEKLIAKRVAEVESLRGELATTAADRDRWESRAREMRSDRAATMQMLEYAQAENAKLSERLDAMQRELVKLAARPPHVIDSSDAIAKITAGLAEMLNGNVIPAPDEAREQFPMGEHVGEIDPFSATRFFVPETEMDSRWNGPLPIPGEWSATTPSVLKEDETPTHLTDPMGNLVRADGQPMFQAGAGQTTPPPGGIE